MRAGLVVGTLTSCSVPMTGAFSVLKLAALDPTIACPGHGDPLTHDIAGRLTAAADNRGER